MPAMNEEKKAEERRSMWKYVLTTADIDGEEDMSYTTYGIEVVDSTGNMAVAYRDVSTKQEFVQRIVDLCNENEADIIHIEDILLDHLG